MDKKKVLHLLTSGGSGGIETLCREIGKNSTLYNSFCFVQNGGIICDQMIDLGLNVINISDCGKKISISKFKRILDISKSYGTVVVHHGDPLLKLYYLFLSLFYKGKLITFIHSCYNDNSQENYYGLKKIINKFITQKTFDISDYVVAVSNAGLNSALSLYKINLNKAIIIYNGISKDYIDSGFNNTLYNHTPYKITYIGRLAKEKGIDLLLTAISKIKAYHNIEVTIVGLGDQYDNLVELCNKLNISEIVKFEGQQLDINKYLSTTSIFVYPSTCEEVFGISLVEAMAYGLPCVANNVGGIPEILIDSHNGVLTKSTDVSGIVNAIDIIIDWYENGKIDTISKNAKETASKFSIVNTCNSFEQLIDSLYN